MINLSGINVVKPETHLQSISSLFVVLLSIATNALIIGSITTTITQMSAFENKERFMRQAIDYFLKQNGVPKILQQSIHAYYDYTGGVQRTFHDMLPKLPAGIAFEVDLYTKRDLFLKVPFFQLMNVQQIIALVPKVSTEDMMPGQTFIRQGFYPDGMFMIARGRVNILVGDDKQPAAVRYPGDYVGEKSLLTDETAKATCCTADWCTLFLLRKRDFLVLCNVYPDLRGVVVFHMKQRDSEDNKKERLCMRQQMNEASVKPRGTKSTKQSTRQSTSRLFGFDLSGLEA